MALDVILQQVIPYSRQHDVYMFQSNQNVKLTAHGLLCPKLTYSGLIMAGKTTLFYNALMGAMNHVPGQSRLAAQICDDIRGCFKINSRDAEQVTNETGDITIPDLLGFTILGPKTPIYIPDLAVDNTSILGNLHFRVKAVDLRLVYAIECTQLAEDDSIILITERILSNAMGDLDGFVSGAKYMFRAQAIFSGNRRSAFTDYVIIRVS